MTPEDDGTTTWNCIRCGRTEELKAYDYRAFRSATDHGEVPRSFTEIAKVLQGRTVYHDLFQASALVCARCVRGERLRRAALVAAPVLVLCCVFGFCKVYYQLYMDDYRAARVELDTWMLEHAEARMPGLRSDVKSREPPPEFVREQSRLQRAKDTARSKAVPLMWTGTLAAMAALILSAWGLWELRRSKVGQSIAVRCLRPSLRRQGLKNIRRGHLAGGQVLHKRSPNQ